MLALCDRITYEALQNIRLISNPINLLELDNLKNIVEGVRQPFVVIPTADKVSINLYRDAKELLTSLILETIACNSEQGLVSYFSEIKDFKVLDQLNNWSYELEKVNESMLKEVLENGIPILTECLCTLEKLIKDKGELTSLNEEDVIGYKNLIKSIKMPMSGSNLAILVASPLSSSVFDISKFNNESLSLNDYESLKTVLVMDDDSSFSKGKFITPYMTNEPLHLSSRLGGLIYRFIYRRCK